MEAEKLAEHWVPLHGDVGGGRGKVGMEQPLRPRLRWPQPSESHTPHHHTHTETHGCWLTSMQP